MTSLPLQTAFLAQINSPSLTFADRRTLLESIEHQLENSSADDSISLLLKDDKIALYTTLAAYHLQNSLGLKSAEKEEQLKRFRNTLTKSDRLEINEKRNFILKGFYCFLLNDFKQAGDYFENACEGDSLNLACLAGKGFLEFHRRNYKEAAGLFKLAFKFYRKAFPQSAYLLGLAYFRLEKHELAKKCFEYFLKGGISREERIQALLALSITALKMKNFDEHYRLILEAFQLSLPQSEGSMKTPAFRFTEANVPLYLAEHYFLNNEYARAEKLAGACLSALAAWPVEKQAKASDLRFDFYEIRSRALYIQAFARHSAGLAENLGEAYKLYSAAVESWPRNFPAQLGLAQVLLAQKNFPDALSALEQICRFNSDNDCRDCHKLFAYLHVRTGNKEAALKSFDRALRYFPRNVEVLADFAGFLEYSDPKAAQRTYAELSKLLEAQAGADYRLPETYNNIAVSLLKENVLEKADECLKKAESLAERHLMAAEANEQDISPRLKAKATEGMSPLPNPRKNQGGQPPIPVSAKADRQAEIRESDGFYRAEAILTTVRFNQAILLERYGKFSSAVSLLSDIIKANPLFIDAHLRLAFLRQKQGDEAQALESVDRALAICSKFPRLSRPEAAISLKAQLLIRQKNYQQALVFLQKTKTADSFVLLLKAEALYRQLAFSREGLPELKRLSREAGEQCRRVLSAPDEEGNLFAANLVAALLAERGRLDQALEITASFQDIIKEHRGLFYNYSLMKFCEGNALQAFSCFDADKARPDARLSALFALVLTVLGEFSQAEKHWKYRLLKDPSLKAFYNLATLLHMKIKGLVKNKKEQIDDAEALIKNARHAENVFRAVFEGVPNKALICLDSQLNCQEVKRRELHALKRKSEHQLFIYKQNEESYQNVLLQEKRKKEEQQISKAERKLVLEVRRDKFGLKDEEQLKREQLLEEELERKAREAALVAQSIGQQLAQGPREQRQADKRAKRRTEGLLEKSSGRKGPAKEAREGRKPGKERGARPKAARRRLSEESEEELEGLGEEDEEEAISQAEFSETEKEGLGSLAEGSGSEDKELIKRPISGFKQGNKKRTRDLASQGKDRPEGKLAGKFKDEDFKERNKKIKESNLGQTSHTKKISPSKNPKRKFSDESNVSDFINDDSVDDELSEKDSNMQGQKELGTSQKKKRVLIMDDED